MSIHERAQMQITHPSISVSYRLWLIGAFSFKADDVTFVSQRFVFGAAASGCDQRVKELWCVNDCCSSVKLGCCYTSIGIGSSTSVEQSLFSIFIMMPSHHRINSNRNTFRMFWKQNLCSDELKAKKTWNFFLLFFARGFSLCSGGSETLIWMKLFCYLTVMSIKVP